MVTNGPVSIPDLPLDPGLLKLQEEEADFFKALTGIHDDKELNQHIVDIAAKAYKVSSSKQTRCCAQQWGQTLETQLPVYSWI